MIFLWREVFFLSATERYLFLGNPDNFFNTPKRFYLQRMYTAQGLIYISYSIYLIRRFKKINLWRWTMFSNRQISFLLYAFVGMFVFVLIVDGSAMFRASRDLMPYQLWYSLPLVTCAFVYTISILILNNSSLFIKGVSLRKPTYKSKELPQTEVTYYLNELRELMEQEHIYLNPELTLSDISSRLGIKPRQLSKILKVHLKSNFYDYVNNYRINKTKEMFAEGKQKEWNLFSIALDSGFNSKSTFNRIFKKKTGYTPSEYISTIKV
ncbi:MAG: helix-turn-helix transcriptional regulator [Bacteroidota bacterium]